MNSLKIISAIAFLTCSSLFAEDSQAPFIEFGKKYMIVFSNTGREDPVTFVVINKYAGNDFYLVSSDDPTNKTSWWINLKQVVSIQLSK